MTKYRGNKKYINEFSFMDKQYNNGIKAREPEEFKRSLEIRTDLIREEILGKKSNPEK